MSSVNANINILVNTSQATAQIRALQAQINTLNATLAQSGSSSMVARQAAMNKALADAATASGLFTAKSASMSHSVDEFSRSLDKGKLSLGQYTRGVMSQMPGMSRIFRQEFDMMAKVAESRVRRLQTQYTALGNAQKALALTPTSIGSGYAAQTALATQKQMIFNKMINDGSTKLLNWGKNTQWAGRQLMVGFTLPLVAFGAVASKVFMDLDRQARDFKRVYGDAFTPPEEINANLKAVEKLALEYTKYGVAISDTMNMAATAAAAGMRNNELLAGTEESLRLATIGQIDYQQSLTTTISLQTAFKTSAQELPQIVDFIGAVANQTVLTVDDMTKAIPRVAPVIAGLGGSIQDLAALLVAMREGGVSAEQGANALKSGLASLINPTTRATEMLSKLGININQIIQSNRGDLMGTINEFADAINGLGNLERQQALEKVFGKYQYARLGALFDNITRKGGQAATALDLAGKSAEELGALSAKSLSEIEQSTTAKFEGAMERLKLAIAPIGEAFLKALTPIIEVISNIAEKFNELPAPIKDIAGKLVAGIGIIAPVLLMLTGLFANLIANAIKGLQWIRKLFATIRGNGSVFKFLSGEELDATAAAASLERATSSLTSKIVMQQEAVSTLAGLYANLAKQMGTVASTAGLPGFIAAKGGSPRKYAQGVTRVPGSGNGDTVPALLTPSESVVTKKATKKYGPIISAMNAGTIKGFARAGGVEKPLPTPLTGILPGENVHRSHVIGLTPDEIGRTLSSGLKMSGIGEFIGNALRQAVVHGVRISGNVLGITERPINASNNPQDLRLATSGWAGTSMFSPASRNSGFYESLPQGLRGSAILQSDYLAQADIARSRMNDPNASPNVRAGATAFMKEYDALEKQGLTLKQNEVKFLQQRIALMHEQDLLDRGVLAEEAKIAAATKAEAQIADMRAKGIIKGTSIVKPSAVTPYMAAEAIRSNVSIGTRSANIPSTLLKNIAVQKLKDTSKWSFSDQIKQTFKRPRANTRQALAIAGLPEPSDAERAGAKAQQSFERGKKSAAKPESSDSAILSRSQKRNSPHPIMGVDGVDDQKAYEAARKRAATQTPQTVLRNMEKLRSSGMNDTQVLRTMGRMNPAAQQTATRIIAMEQSMQKAGMTSAQIKRSLDKFVKAEQQIAVQKEAQARQAAAQLELDKTIAAAQKRQTDIAKQRLAQQRAVLAAQAEQPAPNVRAGVMAAREEAAARRSERFDKMSRGFNNATMGLMGLSMAASFAGGSVGEFAQKIMPVTMGLMGLQMILPMLTSPIGALVLAVTAATALFVKARMDIDNLAKESARAGSNLGSLADGMSIISEATGFKFPTQEDRLFRFDEKSRKAIGEFSSFFESERGSKMVEELKGVSSEERYRKVAFMLQQAISSGLDPKKAREFGQAIAKATGDYVLNSRLMRDFNTGIPNRGGAGLIELEKKRISEFQPTLSSEAYRQSVSSQNMIEAAENMSGAAGALAGALVGLKVGAAVGAAAGSPFAGVGAAPGAGIGAVGGAALGGLAGFFGGRGIGGLLVNAEQEKLNSVTAEAAKALGFAMTTAQDIANIEAVITEERRSGKITYDEYAKQMAEVDKMQADQTAYFRSLFAGGADNDAMKQAMDDLLTLRNFSDEQRKIISEQVNAQSMAQEFFGKNYEELNQQQKDYISKVFEQTMTGLTPENAEQRIQDLQGVWKTIAGEVVAAMVEGAGDVNVEDAYNKETMTQRIGLTFEDAIKAGGGATGDMGALERNINSSTAALAMMREERQKMYDEMISHPGIPYYREELAKQDAAIASTISYIQKLSNQASISAPRIANNLISVQDELDKLYNVGIDQIESVTAAFKDQEYALSVLSSKDQIMKLGKTIAALEKYRKIDIELVMKTVGNPEKLADALERMSKVKMPKGLESLQMNPQDFANFAMAMEEAGAKSVDTVGEIESAYGDLSKTITKAYKDAQSNTTALKGKVKNVNDELVLLKNGNFKVNTSLITYMWGGEVQGSDIQSMLNEAFPDGLDPIRMQLIIEAVMDPVTRALISQYPQLFKNALKGESIDPNATTSGYVGSTFVENIPMTNMIPESTIKFFNSIAESVGQGGFTPPTGQTPPTGGSNSAGGGTPEKTWLQQKIEELAANTVLYKSGTKWAKQTLKERGLFFGALQQLRTGYRINAKGRQRKGFLNAPEQMIAEIGAGPEGLKRIKELFDLSKKKFNDLVKAWNNDILGSKIEQMRAEKTAANQAARVKKILTGAITDDETTKKVEGLNAKQLAAFKFTDEELEKLMSDPDWVTGLLTALSTGKKAVNQYLGETRQWLTSTANEQENAADKAEEAWSNYQEAMDAAFSAKEWEVRNRKAAEFLTANSGLVDSMSLKDAYGGSVDSGEELVYTLERAVQLNQDLIDAQQKIIDGKQEEINDYQHLNDMDQQRIDDMKRQDELRNRISSALQRDLEIMSKNEQKISEVFDKRLQALDKIASINDYIINQNRTQISLAQALSEGDVYAAAQAAADMQAQQAQFATEQSRETLQNEKQLALESLTNSQGLTRKQIEDQIEGIKEQSYQVGLRILAIEDKIYDRNLLIRDLNNQIYDIQEDKIEPLENQNRMINDLLAKYQREVEWAVSHLKVMEITTEEWNKQKNAHQAFMDQVKSKTDVVNAYADAWKRAADELSRITGVSRSEYQDALPSSSSSSAPSNVYYAPNGVGYANDPTAPYYSTSPTGAPIFNYGYQRYAGGLISKYSTGSIVGDGARDSVPAMLTPGEYVIRKSMVEKYGKPVFDALNMGSFTLPNYGAMNSRRPQAMPNAASTIKVAASNNPVYNSYSVNVSATTNASADEIANKVISKIRNIESMAVRGYRGN